MKLRVIGSLENMNQQGKKKKKKPHNNLRYYNSGKMSQ